jgi:hypothetical protein
MKFKDRVMNVKPVKDFVLSNNYGSNIYDMDYRDGIQKGIVDKLMKARDLGVRYCVVFGRYIPSNSAWDPYVGGNWNPIRDYITTEDIATEDNNREQEIQNIYAFLRGETIEKQQGRGR